MQTKYKLPIVSPLDLRKRGISTCRRFSISSLAVPSSPPAAQTVAAVLWVRTSGVVTKNSDNLVAAAPVLQMGNALIPEPEISGRSDNRPES